MQFMEILYSAIIIIIIYFLVLYTAKYGETLERVCRSIMQSAKLRKPRNV